MLRILSIPAVQGQRLATVMLIVGASIGLAISLPIERNSITPSEPTQQFNVKPEAVAATAREQVVAVTNAASSGQPNLQYQQQDAPKGDQVTPPAASSSSVTYANEQPLVQEAPLVAITVPLSGAAAVSNPTKLKRDSRAKLTSLELDTLETGFLHPHLHPDPPYPLSAGTKDSGYDYDSGKNSYGKQASDWTLYDQGNDGLYDKYGDKGWNDQGHDSHSAYGKHDSYGNSYQSQNGGHSSGYYSRNRGYGYEKHYAYDKEVASKQHADNHNDYGNQHGLHDYYGNAASIGHHNQGHDRYGQLSRYGNHGYGKRGSDLAAHYDYGHDHNKGHYYAQHIPVQHHNSPPSNEHYHHSSYGGNGYSHSSPVQHKTSYSDYSPYVGYPSSYPSYY